MNIDILKHATKWIIFLGIFFYTSYGFSNYLASQLKSVESIYFEWENNIPFIACSIFIYWSLNIFYTISFFFSKDIESMNQLGFRLAFTQVVAIIFFIIYPLKFSFNVPEVSGISATLFDILKSFDQPFNQAPSLHIALTVILWDWYRRIIRNKLGQLFLHIWSFFICLSVLTTYQHHFIDIPTGFLLGVFTVWLFPIEKEFRINFKITKNKKRLKMSFYYFMSSVFVLLFSSFGVVALLISLYVSISLFSVSLNYLFLDTKGFRVDKDGNILWSAKIIFLPYKIGVKINRYLWLLSSNSIDHIIDNIYLGRMPNKKEYLKLNKPIIVTLAPEITVLKDAMYDKNVVLIPFLDLIPITENDFIDKFKNIDEIDKNENIIFCCALGYSRSAFFLLMYLLYLKRVSSVDEGYNLLELKRKQIRIKEVDLISINKIIKRINEN